MRQHFTTRIRCIAGVGTVLLFMQFALSTAQSRLNLEFLAPQMSLAFPSFAIEYNAYKLDTTVQVLNSIRVAFGYGAQWSNAKFIPIDIRFVLFRGSFHLDLVVGAAIQLAFRENNSFEGFRSFPSSPINPTLAAAMRYQSPDGGFLCRLGY